MKYITALFAVAFTTASLTTHAVTITPQQMVRLEFSLTGLPQPTTDMLIFEFRSLSFFEPGFPADAVFSATLLDGGRVLGTDFTSLVPPSEPERRQFVFASGASLWSFYDPARVDLASLLDGTINGAILISSDKPYNINFNPFLRNFELNLAHAVSGDTAPLLNSPNYAYTTSYSVITPVPLPTSVTLLIAGLAVLSLVRRKSMDLHARA